MKFTRPHAYLLVFFTFLAFGGTVGQAEERIWPGFEEAESLDKLPSAEKTNESEIEADALPLDRAVTSVLGSLPVFLNNWEKNHFMSYLAVSCIAAGLVLGLGVAVLVHLNVPPHGKWTEVWRKSLLMATSIGAGLSILLVTLHFSVPAHAKITYLVMAFVFCSISAGVGCALGLSVLRKLRILKAKKMGVKIDNERMWIR